MTVEMFLMSRPREATSVARRKETEEERKASTDAIRYMEEKEISLHVFGVLWGSS